MFTAITVTYNSAHTIRRLISTLCTHLEGKLSEIIVIDNNSVDETRSTVRELAQDYPIVRLVENDANVGYRRAINQGVQLASSEVLLVINPDAWVEDDSVSQCLEEMVARPATGYLSPAVIESGRREPTVHTTVIVPFLYSSVESFALGSSSKTVEVAAGPAFVVRRSLFLRCGGYDEGIFMYNEEEEICSKFRGLDAEVMVEPAARVYHDVGQSVRTIGARMEFLVTHLLGNARYLYIQRSRDKAYMRCLWTAFFLLRAFEYSIAIGRGSPLRVALSPWRDSPRLASRGDLMQASWHLRLWLRAWLGELQDYLTSEFDSDGRLAK